MQHYPGWFDLKNLRGFGSFQSPSICQQAHKIEILEPFETWAWAGLIKRISSLEVHCFK